jgi:hypothetical protein
MAVASWQGGKVVLFAVPWVMFGSCFGKQKPFAFANGLGVCLYHPVFSQRTAGRFRVFRLESVWASLPVRFCRSMISGNSELASRKVHPGIWLQFSDSHWSLDHDID